jgi:hypothetical protein
VNLYQKRIEKGTILFPVLHKKCLVSIGINSILSLTLINTNSKIKEFDQRTYVLFREIPDLDSCVLD